MSASSTIGSAPNRASSATPPPAYSPGPPPPYSAASSPPAYSSAFNQPTNYGKEIENASRAQLNLERACKKDIKKGSSPDLARAMAEFKNAQSEFAASARSGGSDIQQKHMAVLNAKSVLLFNAPDTGKLRGSKMQKQLTKMMRADTAIYNKGTEQAARKLGMPSPPALKVPKSFRKDQKTVAKNQKQMRKSLDRLLKKSRTVDGRKLDRYQKDAIKQAIGQLDARQTNFMATLGSGSPDAGYAWDALKTAHKAVQEVANQNNVSLNGSKSGDSYWKLNQVSQSLFANCQNNLKAQLEKNPKPAVPA